MRIFATKLTSNRNHNSERTALRFQRGNLSQRKTISALVLILLLAGTSFAANQEGARPTLRVGQGNRLEFCQYAAANGSAYGADCKLKVNNIQTAWADVSDIVIDGVFEIKRTDPTQRVTDVLVANKLTIDNGGRIVTNGNGLYIFVNEFVAFNNAAIVSFEDQNRRAPDGAAQTAAVGSQGAFAGAPGLPGLPGNSGVDGEGGGAVIIFANNFSGPLLIDLRGQDGGSGGQGGVGGNGLKGFKGEDASSGAFGCNHGGGGGGRGGNGGQGGFGGSAGKGGDGGLLGFFYVNSTSIDPPKNPQTTLLGGAPGNPGQGGTGGAPGDGGEGGNGSGFCGGGPKGSPGSAGGAQGPGAPAAAGVNGSIQLIKLASIAKVQDGFRRAIAEQSNATSH